MASALVILLIVFATALLGLLLLAQFGPLRALSLLDAAFTALVLGVLLVGWMGLILAELSLFSGPAIAGLWFGAAAILLWIIWRRSRLSTDAVLAGVVAADPANHSRHDRSYQEYLLVVTVLFWLVAVGWLFFRPHEYILGGADAGVYVSLGAEIAQHGGFRLVDETLAALDPAVQAAFLRPLPTNPVAPAYLLPGFYVTDAAAGTIVPQFYPLHPVWQAIAYSVSGTLVDGARTALLFPGLWMTLSSIAIVLIGLELGGWPAALLLLVALPITALQAWFARYPTTEALTQFLIWAGLWALLLRFEGRQPVRLWAFVAGAALGSVFLVRIDILVLLPVFGMLMFAFWFRGWQPADTWFAAPFVVLLAHSLVHGLVFSAPYFYEHVGYGLRLLWVNWWIPVAGLAAAAGVLWAVWAIRKRGSSFAQFKRPLVFALIAFFLSFAIYSWFVRPYTSTATFQADAYSETQLLITNHENFLRLGWYLALPGIWFGVAGICWMLWRVESKTAVLLAVGIVFTVIYLWNNRANPVQVYVMRRYVPAVVPFFLVGGAYFISNVAAIRWRPGTNLQVIPAAAAVLLGLVWLAGLGWSARGFVSQIDYKGLLDQLADFEQQLPPNSILLFDDQSPVGQGDFWGTPLTYIFGHEAFTIRDAAILDGPLLVETIEVWQNNGRSVVWLGDPAWLAANGFGYTESLFTIASSRLESSYEHKPREIIDETWAFQTAVLDQLQ